MVDRINLQQVNQLYFEFNQIERAEENLNHDGRINSMVIVGTTPDIPSAIVNTQGWPYPQTMVTGIKQLLAQRKAEIISELGGLGLTGIEAPMAPQPAPAAARRR